MKLCTTQLALGALAIAGAFAAPAAFAQGTFTPGSGTSANCNVGTSGTTVDDKTCTVGTASAAMQVWGFTGNTLSGTAQTGFQRGRLADWDGGGFGAYTGNKEAGSNQHSFDNVTSGCNSTVQTVGGTISLSTANSGCGGGIEALFLDFSGSAAKVNLTNVGIGWNGGDADLSVWAWTGTGGPNMTNQTAAGSPNSTSTTADDAGVMAGWTLVSNHNFGTGTGTQNTNGTLFSSYFMVTTYFGATGSNATGHLDAGNDRFKLNSFSVDYCTGAGKSLTGGTSGTGASGGNGATCSTTTTGRVSEPGSLALAGLGLIGAFGLRRRIRKA